MAIFKGAGVAIVTPMYEDGKVNYDKLEELLEYQIANSTDAIIISPCVIVDHYLRNNRRIINDDAWRAS